VITRYTFRDQNNYYCNYNIKKNREVGCGALGPHSLNMDVPEVSSLYKKFILYKNYEYQER